MSTFRWVAFALLPALFLALLVRRTPGSWPIGRLASTFALGGILAAAVFFVEDRIADFSNLHLSVERAGQAGALLFLGVFVAPLREGAKVLAVWPAFRSADVEEPLAGVVYACAGALGFAAIESALYLRAHDGAIALARVALGLPAHAFFAALWGFSLGRAKERSGAGAFPYVWLGATASHALYLHLLFGRGPGAMVGLVPLLCVMGAVVVIAARDFGLRAHRSSLMMSQSGPVHPLPPASMRSVREALRKTDRPISFGWVALGAFVTLGAMILGIAAAVVFGRMAGVDFAAVDERDVATVGPVALLGAGLLVAFPVSGFLVARASGLPTLLEPAFASLVALAAMLVVLGVAAPVSVVFAVALAPFGFALACAGAWVGRPAA